MNLVLDEEVDQRYESRKERSSKDLPVLEGSGVARAQGETAESPGQSSDQIRDHEDVMPVMVVSRRDVCPSTAGQCSENANASDEFGKGGIGSAGQDVPKADERKSRT